MGHEEAYVRSDDRYGGSLYTRGTLSPPPLLKCSHCNATSSCRRSHTQCHSVCTALMHRTPLTHRCVHCIALHCCWTQVLQLFNSACATTLFPFLERAYSQSRLGATASNLRVWDAFVVRCALADTET